MKKKHKPKKKAPKLELQKIEKTVKSIIAEIAEVDVKKIRSNADFAKELNLNSMAALEILAAIEKTYKIEVPEEYLPKMGNLKDVLNIIRKVADK